MNAFRLPLLLILMLVGHIAGFARASDRPFCGKVVLFGVSGSGVHLIQTMNPDGTGLQTVLKLPDPIVAGRVAPDCRRLAFSVNPTGTRRLEIWILTADGARRKIADKGFVRAWSPDAQQVACYASDGKEGWENFLVSASTGETHALPIPHCDAVEDWSPDGQFLSVMAGNIGRKFQHETKGTYPLRQIYLIKIDGSGRQMLTPEPTHDFFWSRFSPDGKRVAHYRREYVNRSQSPIETLIVRQRDRSRPSQVLSFASYSTEQVSVRPFGFPTWSPDGRSLLWAADRRRRDRGELEPGKRIAFDLFVVSVESGAVRRIDLDKIGIRGYATIDWR